jgi:hypothetical protein
MSDLCLEDFNKYLLEMKIFEKDGYCYVFDKAFLYSLLHDILILTSKDEFNYQGFSITDIFNEKLAEMINEDYWNIINKLSYIEKEFVLRYICDVDSTLFSLNVNKIKIFCAKSIFYKKEISMKLYDFFNLLTRTFELVFPSKLNDILVEENVEYTLTNCEDNLFECFKEYDLRFLNGYCFIYFLRTQRDPLIQ